MSKLPKRSLDGLEKSLFCPNCKAKTRINYKVILKNDDQTIFTIAECIDCNRLTFMLYKMVDDGVRFHHPSYSAPVKLIYSYPNMSETKISNIPKKIASSYLEGVRCLDANSPNGAVTMFRRSLQQICVEKGANPKDRLVDQIKVLPEQVRPTAKEIKAWGNLGAHEDSNGKVEEVNKEQADAIKRFLEGVFLVVYQHPIELEHLRGQRV